MAGPEGYDGLELELELRPSESVALAGQARERAETLLDMDTSDEFGLPAGDRPVVPKGAEDLVAYYEKQLAATQLVQHRLTKQYNQLSEEKMSLEASFQVQIATMQQQLAVVHERAQRACQEAERSQQQVHTAHQAVEEIVKTVTDLAERLDDSGATQELTRSFEAVAHSTQSTFEAITEAQHGVSVALELQIEVREACLESPLLTSATSMAAGLPRVADALKDLEEDALRLRRELHDAKSREQQMDQELQAAQRLFAGLEAEVISLQQDQAQAAAKLQMSHEELLAARAELVATKQVLTDMQSPAAESLGQGLEKLDAHLASIREFLQGLSMPPPPPPEANSGLLQEQRAAAQTPNSASVAERPTSTSSVALAQALAASRGSTVGGASVESTGSQAQAVETLSSERDALQQQLELVSANVAVLEGRLEEAAHENDRLLRQLAATEQQLLGAAAHSSDLLTRIAMLEGKLDEARASGARSGAAAGGGSSTHSGADDEQRAAAQPLQAQPPPVSVAGSVAGDDMLSPSSSTMGLHGADAVGRSGSKIPRPPADQQTSARPSENGSVTSSPGRIPKPVGSFQARSPLQASTSFGPTSPNAAAAAAHTAELEQQLEELTVHMMELEEQHRAEQEARQLAEGRAASLAEEKEMTAVLLSRLGEEQIALAEQLRDLEDAKEALDAERSQLLDRASALSSQVGDLAAERDLLVRRVAQLSAHADSLVEERDELLASQERQIGVAAAAGAAGAAAAVVVAHEAAAASVPTSRAVPLEGEHEANVTATGSARSSSAGPQDSADLGARVAQLESELAGLTAEHDAVLERAANLEGELEAMMPLLQQAADEREAALQQLEQLAEERADEAQRYSAERLELEGKLQAAIAAAAAAAAVASSGTTPRLVLDPRSRNRALRTSISQPTADEPESGPLQSAGGGSELSGSLDRIAPPSSRVLSNTLSMLSDMPLVPATHPSSGSGNFALDPTDPLDDYFAVGSGPGSRRGGNSGAAPRLPAGQLQQSSTSEEVTQLQAAVCSLLVSKAMASAQQQAEHEAELSVLKAAHEAELAQLRERHASELDELQNTPSHTGTGAGAQPPASTARRLSAARSSSRSLPDLPEEAEETEDGGVLRPEDDQLLSDHTEGLLQQISELQEQALQREEDFGAQLAALQVRHDGELSELQALHEEQLRQALEALAEQQEQEEPATVAPVAAAPRRLALDPSPPSAEQDAEVAALQQSLVDVQDRVAQHAAELLEQQAAHERELEQARLAAQRAEAAAGLVPELEARLEQQRAGFDTELSALEQRLAVLREEAAEHQARAAELQAALDEQQALAAPPPLLRSSPAPDQEAELVQLRDQTAAYEQEVEQLRAVAASGEEAAAALTALRAQLAEQQADREVELSALNQELSSLREQAAAYQQELEQLRAVAASSEEAAANVAALRSQLAELQADREVELSALSQELSNLREQTAAQESRSEELLARLGEEQERGSNAAELGARLAAQEQQQAAAMAELEQELEVARAQCAEREAMVTELQGLMQQVQSEKEVEEQSLQSLQRTKAWMTEEIRSLQGDLKEAQSKLQAAEAELAALKAAAAAAGTATAVASASRSAPAASKPSPLSRPSAAATPSAAAAAHISKAAPPAEEEEPTTLAAFAKRAARQSLAGKHDAAATATASGKPPPGSAAAAAERRSSAGSIDPHLDTAALRKKLCAAEAQIQTLGVQLAEAAMQAALAEARCESLEQERESGGGGGGRARSGVSGDGGPQGGVMGPLGAQQTDMMMETVALHGELDEVKGKQRVMVTKLEAVTDEMVHAVLRASLAEAQLEDLRARVADQGGLSGARGGRGSRAARLSGGGAAAASSSPFAALQSRAATVISAARRGSNSGSAAPSGSHTPPGKRASVSQPSINPDPRSERDLPPPDHLGTKTVSPLEQTCRLQTELQAVALALNELFGEDPDALEHTSRQTLSTLRPAVITALHITESMASSLQRSQLEPPSRSTPRIGTAGRPASGGGAGVPPELERARSAYRDARDVFDMLRSDAEELNSRLWRWGANLRSQLTAMELRMSRGSVTAAAPDAQAAVTRALSHKDSYLRNAESQIAELQASLQAAHARLLRRDEQVASLQDLLVQLSEQLTMFEGVIVRCEVLSADLVGKTGGVPAAVGVAE